MARGLLWCALLCAVLATCTAIEYSNEIKGDDDLPACAEGRAKTFLLGFTGHTGSTAMISMMQRHTGLYVPGLEPLTPKTQSDKVDFTMQMFGNSEFTDKVIGFKIRSGDIGKAEADFGRIVKDHKTRLITLVRKNFFKAAMGLYTIRALMDNSAMMGLSPSEAEVHCKEQPEHCRFEIRDMKFFAWLVHRYIQGSEVVEKIKDRLPFACELEVTYEEFLENRDMVMARIYKFLGVENEVNPPAFAKVVADNPCDVISNYQDVCRQLWGCENMREYLEDPAHQCYCEDKSGDRIEELCDYSVLMQKGTLICYDKIGHEVPCST